MKMRLSTIFILIIIVLCAALISTYWPVETFQTAESYRRKRPEGRVEIYADPNMTEDEIRILKEINRVGNQLVADAEYDNVDTSYLKGKQLSPPPPEISQVSVI